MIEVRNLTKRYGKNTVVDNLSFTVEKGEIYGFLGPNGAGKSTTMNIMTGYIAATEGDVIVDGYDILHQPKEAKSKIGYLPEIPPLYTDMTVGEYLLFAAELKGIEKSERAAAVRQAEETVKIEDMEHKLIKNLSKGYKQRVGLAQALIGHPDVLILDEPTVGLDPAQIIEIRNLIKSLGSQHTIILSSHILSEVSAVCDKVMIINHGKLVACDTPENLMDSVNPISKFVIEVRPLDDPANAKDINTTVSSVEGFRSIETTETAHGTVVVNAEFDRCEGLKDSIALAFMDARYLVLGMNEESGSLEDLFLELTDPALDSAISNVSSEEGDDTLADDELGGEDDTLGSEDDTLEDDTLEDGDSALAVDTLEDDSTGSEDGANGDDTLGSGDSDAASEDEASRDESEEK